MALVDLVSRLEQDTARDVRAIAEQADAEVAAIRAGTEREIAETGARDVDERRARRRALEQRELVVARRQAHAAELRARHAHLARILARAHALVPELASSDAYRRALPSHLEEALAYVEGLRPRVRCQAAFAELLAPLVARHEGAELVVDAAVGPGLVVEAADGSVVVDNTLEGRLSRIEDRLAVDLLAEEHGVRG
jgi:vacuolar-type H+-ATPase subunit E/Vma4